MNHWLRPTAWLALAALIVLAPLMLALSLLVRVAIGSPILFRQHRSGRGGVPFVIVKFRTMRDLRGADGSLLPDAARTPAVGRWLRRTRLDELPELVNIIVGDMAFVGPRPLLPKTIAEMGARGIRRGTLRPGLTGLAQVSGNTLLTLDEKLDLDLRYVRGRNVVLDLEILLRTAVVVLFGERRSGRHDQPRHHRRGS